ncbi:hypothetical protein FH972_026623 [Carpinus fangiana]|uniref:Uncharacterized protein n=1 Tax=Carpinus fangiana TaxID=176857 RepID=A0A5N6L5H2_9ROSI|nr:hypothetical protein FH972_026623 [Carpinus fangiana]
MSAHLNQRIVLITGANSGIGYATAKVLASKESSPYHVILAGRSPEKLQAAQDSLVSDKTIDSSVLSTVTLDLTSIASIRAAAQHVTDKHGRLDALINNAGIYVPNKDDTLESLEDELTRTFATNTTGPALVTHAFAPLLRRSSNPYLVYVSSALGSLAEASDTTRPDVGLQALGYRVSKAGMSMLAIRGHVTLGSEGVKVLAICPGLVESNLRGESEAARTYGGLAADPAISGRLVEDILQGKRDGDLGKFVHKGGLYGW